MKKEFSCCVIFLCLIVSFFTAAAFAEERMVIAVHDYAPFSNSEGKGDIQKQSLPSDLVQFGTDKASLEAFGNYEREPWGKIK